MKQKLDPGTIVKVGPKNLGVIIDPIFFGEKILNVSKNSDLLVPLFVTFDPQRHYAFRILGGFLLVNQDDSDLGLDTYKIVNYGFMLEEPLEIKEVDLRTIAFVSQEVLSFLFDEDMRLMLYDAKVLYEYLD